MNNIEYQITKVNVIKLNFSVFMRFCVWKLLIDAQYDLPESPKLKLF